MSPLISIESATLEAQAMAAGFVVLAAAAWPESADDTEPPALAGFVASSFSPIAAEVARRCLERRRAAPHPDPVPTDTARTDTVRTDTVPTDTVPTDTALIVISALGDLAAARSVAGAVDTGARVPPLMFFQCVPNAVAGYVAARWRLTGPVVCLGGELAALDTAGLLLDDGDAEQVLLIHVEQGATAQDRDSACAVLLAADAPSREGG